MKNFKKKTFFREEFIKRYIYLYNNVHYILAYYMVENKKENEVYLDKIDVSSMRVIEEFLLGLRPFQETEFYLKLEELKTNKDFLKIVKRGHQLLIKKNQQEEKDYSFNVYTLLVNLRNFILGERVDLTNRELKLEVLDEYFNLNNYRLNGRIKTIGFDNSIFNEENEYLLSNYFYERRENDFGLLNNAFINYFTNTYLSLERTNANFLNHEEKEKVYRYIHSVEEK